MFTYRYTELIKTASHKVEHFSSVIESVTIKEKELEKEAEKLALCVELFRGKGPWVACRSTGYPLMVFEHKDVSEIFTSPPTPQGYVKLGYVEGKGNLFYCKKNDNMASAENYVYNTKFVSDKDYEPYLYEDNISENKLMHDIGGLPEDKRAENSYVNWRLKCWKANFLLPQQYLPLGWGNSIHLMRISRIHNLTLTQAWDMMWLGRIERKKKAAEN